MLHLDGFDTGQCAQVHCPVSKLCCTWMAVRLSALSAAPWADWLDWTTDGWWGVSKTTLERLEKIKKTYDSDINFL